MTKDQLKDTLESDLAISRGAMLEIIEHNRVINIGLVEEFTSRDYSHLEEYSMLTEAILKSTKLLNEIHANTPKVIKDIDAVREKEEKINLDDLIE